MIRRRTHHLLVVTLVAFAVVTWFHTAPLASGPIGVYALIDKVVLEPNDTMRNSLAKRCHLKKENPR